MRQGVLLFWRTARFEILAGLGLCLALTAGMLVVVERLDAIRADVCPNLRTCEDPAFYGLQQDFAAPLLFAASLIPLVVGLLYGPPLVARELERRSAPLAWSLTSSRVRWLLWRAWPAAGLIVLLLTGTALAGDRLEAAVYPQFDPAQSFYDVGSRGELVVLRGLAAFAFGLAAGVVVGRTLPATFLAGGLCIVGLGLAASVLQGWLPREEVPRAELDQATRAVPLAFGEGYRLPDGRLLTFDESAPLRPPEAQIIDTPDYAVWLFHSGWKRVFIGISGTHFQQVELREAGATVAVALAGLGVALLAVRRRRPVPGISLEPDARRATVGPVEPPRLRGAWRRTGAWLSWLMTARVGRPELLGAIVAAVGVTGATLAVIKLLADARVTQNCVNADCVGAGAFSQVNNPLTDWLYPLLASLPFVVGGLLGAPVIARELESGTGRLTWSLATSRVRWLVWRVAPLIALVIVMLVPAAIAGNALLHEQTLLDPTYFWSDGQIRGAPLVARGLATFAIAVLAGVLVRRTLPALIVAGIAGIILYNGLDLATTHWLPLDVIGNPSEAGDVSAITPGSYLWSAALEAPDGSFHFAQDVALANGFPRKTPDGTPIDASAEFIAWYTAHDYRFVNAGWDARLYPQAMSRETATLVGGAVLVVILAAAALRRARPG